MRINMKNWDDEALLLIVETTHDEVMKKYIKTIFQNWKNMMIIILSHDYFIR